MSTKKEFCLAVKYSALLLGGNFLDVNSNLNL